MPEPRPQPGSLVASPIEMRYQPWNRSTFFCRSTRSMDCGRPDPAIPSSQQAVAWGPGAGCEPALHRPVAARQRRIPAASPSAVSQALAGGVELPPRGGIVAQPAST